MTDLQVLRNSFFEFCLVATTYYGSVPLFYPKVHLIENSLLKILAQLHSVKVTVCYLRKNPPS